MQHTLTLKVRDKAIGGSIEIIGHMSIITKEFAFGFY